VKKKAAAPAKKAPVAKKAVPAAKKAAPVAKKAAPVAKKAAPAPAPEKKPAAPIRQLGPVTPPAPIKKIAPARKTPLVLDKFLLGQQAALIEERATYTHQAETLQAEADELAAEREPGDVQFDEESGEGDTLAVERERDLALSFQARAAVDEIDAALAKILEGTYGTCEQCGNTIPRERLAGDPVRGTVCVMQEHGTRSAVSAAAVLRSLPPSRRPSSSSTSSRRHGRCTRSRPRTSTSSGRCACT